MSAPSLTLADLTQFTDNSLLRTEVATMILNCCDENYAGWFEDRIAHGCASAMVGPLIYYCDTHAVFDRYYSEIEEFRERYHEETEQALPICDHFKNHLAWFALKQVASEFYSSLSERGLL